MRLRSDARGSLAAALAFVALAACTSSSSSGTATISSPPPSSTTAASPSGGPSGGQAVGSTLNALAPAGGSFLVHGAYPTEPSRCKHAKPPRLLARYPGKLTIARAGDGTLGVTVTLPFESYLEGLAEVPSSWPMAAMEAQAIAARSYALAETGWHGPAGGTLANPICATTSCQVYGGIPVPFLNTTPRWYAAVHRTAGQVLMFGDRPADTVYFSTSNGHTYGNDQVFGSDPLPYLRPVPEHDDGASPESHWTVPIPFADLARFLHAGGNWPAARITSATVSGSSVTLSGGGAHETLPLSTVRDDVNAWSECLAPSRYPPDGWNGVQLAETIPSSWMTASATPSALVLRGRGWGHGVGMVQWGAYGKAKRGLSAARILAYYYGGLTPTAYPEPGLIHVRVASGLTSLTLRPSGTGGSIDGARIGRGPVVITGGSTITVAGAGPAA
ncbi:MAG TPA: SpoIID/LytB domain-containing protein [Actinomycetota bacterium]|nr:SpoIID/LytB domain-containing protein [Actinomycetota bacterium]